MIGIEEIEQGFDARIVVPNAEKDSTLFYFRSIFVDSIRAEILESC